MGDSKTVLKIDSITKSFGDQKVLQNIKIDVKRGEIFGIIGPSGSGKTTLINILTGNLLADKGIVLYEPKDVAKFDVNSGMQPTLLHPKLLRHTLGYSPQSPSVYDKLTCQENLDLFGSMYNLPTDVKVINRKILLRLVGLEQDAHKRADALSGGMKKRLDLACSLVHDPKILVLDEPTSDLDPFLRKQMWMLIKRINQKGTTVIMSSHFLDEIEGLCDRIAIINNNKVEFLGNPREVKKKSKDVTLKIETEEAKYDALKKVLAKTFKNSRFYIGDSLEITIKNVRNLGTVTQKAFNAVKKAKQKVLHLSYSKTGISEAFEKVLEIKPEDSEDLNSFTGKMKEIKLSKWKL